VAATCRLTVKVRYRTHLDARIALLRTTRNTDSRRAEDEKRAYPCPDCRGWHLTSLTTCRK
jgi:hypothetical protein